MCVRALVYVCVGGCGGVETQQLVSVPPLHCIENNRANATHHVSNRSPYIALGFVYLFRQGCRSPRECRHLQLKLGGHL